jgi:hypothetical protein
MSRADRTQANGKESGPMTRYTIRYRASDRAGRTVLLVADQQGTVYLFKRGRLRRWALRHDNTPHPFRHAAGYTPWIRVPAVSPYTIAELRHLTATQLPSPVRALQRRLPQPARP